MRLIASDVALDLLIALSQADDTRLTALAHDAGIGVSTAQKGLDVLITDGLAARAGTSHYHLAETPTTGAAVQLALHARDSDRVAAIIGGANEGVELIVRTETNLVVVFGRHAEVDQRLRAHHALAVLAEREGLQLIERQHDDLRAHRADFASERELLAAGRACYGNLDASYPPVPPRAAGGHALGQLNSALSAPSARRLRELSRRHGIRRLQVFGSAVRDDFRPDSDVDVAVDLVPGTSHRVLARIEEELERIFDRDVDVVVSDLLRGRVRKDVEEHGVTLVG